MDSRSVLLGYKKYLVPINVCGIFLVICGLVLSGNKPLRTMDAIPLLKSCALLALMISILGLVGFRGLGKREVDEKRSLTECAVFLVLVFPSVLSLAMTTGVCVNRWFDRGGDVRMSVQIEAKYEKQGGKGGPRHYVVINDWKYGGRKIELKVGGFEYKRANVGDLVLVVMGPGALGMEWVKELGFRKMKL